MEQGVGRSLTRDTSEQNATVILAVSKEKRHPIINAAYYCHRTSQRFGNDKALPFEHALERLVASISSGTIFGIDVPTYSYLTGLFVFACNDGTEPS